MESLQVTVFIIITITSKNEPTILTHNIKNIAGVLREVTECSGMLTCW